MVIEEYEEADVGEIWTIIEQVRPSNASGELHTIGRVGSRHIAQLRWMSVLLKLARLPYLWLLRSMRKQIKKD